MQRTKEGTAALLAQSGLDDQWWDLAMQCCCFLRNTVDHLVIDAPPDALRKETQGALPEQVPSATAYTQ